MIRCARELNMCLNEHADILELHTRMLRAEEREKNAKKKKL